jgi:hypothetical protein
MTQELFNKSKNKRGFIYLCEMETGYFLRKANETQYLPEKLWKYGKTVNLENRMKLYGEKYKLIESWEVDHLPLREKLINWDHEITENREWQQKPSHWEHVEFDCYKIVEYYATSELRLTREFGRWNIKVNGIKESPHFFTTAGVDENILMSIIKM